MVNGPQLSLTRPAADRTHDAMVRISAYICRVKIQAPVEHSSQPSFLPSLSSDPGPSFGRVLPVQA